MPDFPLRIPRDTYWGKNLSRTRSAERFNALAEKLERHINSQVEASNDRVQIFYYGGIAIDLGIPESCVEKVLFGEGGGNGITIVKRIATVPRSDAPKDGA
jgi:hypothetical protein